MVYRQHAQFVQDNQFWGHWAHQRTDARGRIYYLSPEVILLMLCALELVRIVWRMPWYRRASWPCRAVHAPQIGLFE
jgi:hypothetical protein